MNRLVAVSNRVGPVRGANLAGGLAVALVDALSESHGLWLGWSGNTVSGGAAAPKLREVGGITQALLDLDRDDFEAYYNGFANGCLWPMFHFRLDLSHYEQRYIDAYRRVNAQFAKVLHPLLRPSDLIWAHDYHLFALASELRALGTRQRIGFFLHTPFPPRDLLMTLPNHQWLIRCLFDYDLVGFQTEPDFERFRDYVVREAGGRVQGDRVLAYGREIQAGAFPVGIDAEQFAQMAESGEREPEYRKMAERLDGRTQIVGVDRLDYSKGLLRRMAAYETLLETHEDAHGCVELLQIAPISRGELDAYRDFRLELEQSAAQINGRFGRLNWTPVRYLNQALPRRTLAWLYRASKIGVVTPVRDGMNLVAKEYVAAQNPADPGVLVLSRFAGAAQQMKAALLVNPYDGFETAEALQCARMMPIEERRNRYAELMRGLVEYDAARWREQFVDRLRTTRLQAAA
ncbi:MAG TPA: trehalose-6-phosphate synthase [Nevskiaceae bacterium]|nr:trehalose-6-phosphate synthase [Nevskiaceae bacterium]